MVVSTVAFCWYAPPKLKPAYKLCAGKSSVSSGGSCRVSGCAGVVFCGWTGAGFGVWTGAGFWVGLLGMVHVVEPDAPFVHAWAKPAAADRARKTMTIVTERTFISSWRAPATLMPWRPNANVPEHAVTGKTQFEFQEDAVEGNRGTNSADFGQNTVHQFAGTRVCLKFRLSVL